MKRAGSWIMIIVLVSVFFARVALGQTPEIYFARANFSDIKVYSAPNLEALFIPSHDRIYKNSVQRLEVVDSVWARLYPDNGLYSPWLEYDGVANTYVLRQDFSPITNFEPITVLDGTSNENKMVIVMRVYYPYLMLVEVDGDGQPQVIAKIPTCLGGYFNDSTTPLGFFHADAIWVSRHMNTLPGVPFTVFYSQYLGTALHGAPWRDWDQMERGCYGSAGCINLPTPSKWDVYWQGEQLGFDHFFFNWARGTNLFFDPYTEEPYSVQWTQDGWYEGEKSLRVYVVESLDELWRFPVHPTNQGILNSWRPIIDQIESLEGFWRLPNSVDGEVSFRDIPQVK